jgi:hypothetical protein
MLTMNAQRMKTVDVLVNKSHQDYIDLVRDLPWDAHQPELPLRRDASSWIYGTKHWEVLTPAQRQELQRQEMARDVSMFIQLEETIPVLYQGYVNRYGRELPPAVRNYLSLFSKEEIVHTLMFQRYLERTGLEIYAPPEGYKELFLDKLPAMHPIYGITATLAVEILAEDGAMFATQDDSIDPLTKTLFYRHHREELRHIAFGKLMIGTYLETATVDEAAQLRGFIANVLAKTSRNYLFNPDIMSRLSFPLLPDGTDHDEIRMSDHNRATNPARFPMLFSWCEGVGLTPVESSSYFA